MNPSIKHATSTFVFPTLLLTFLLYIIPLLDNSPSVSIITSTNIISSSLFKNSSSMNQDELEAALEGASNANKTVIIAVMNKAYTEGEKSMFDIFLDGFWLGEDTRQLKDHLLIVAVDQTAFERCMFLRLHCYRLKSDEGQDYYASEKLFLTEDFIKMMWLRTGFLLDVLRRGYNFVFTDTDVVWLRNPFPYLSQYEDVDLQASVDGFSGDQWAENYGINTGFYMIRSNNKTISLFDEWYERRNNSTGKKEQDVMNDLIFEGAFRRLGLKHRLLDTNYFSGFCQDSKDVTLVTTVHANCCGSIKNKVNDLTSVLRDWKTINDMIIVNKTAEFEWSKHVGCHGT